MKKSEDGKANKYKIHDGLKIFGKISKNIIRLKIDVQSALMMMLMLKEKMCETVYINKCLNSDKIERTNNEYKSNQMGNTQQ